MLDMGVHIYLQGSISIQKHTSNIDFFPLYLWIFSGTLNMTLISVQVLLV